MKPFIFVLIVSFSVAAQTLVEPGTVTGAKPFAVSELVARYNHDDLVRREKQRSYTATRSYTMTTHKGEFIASEEVNTFFLKPSVLEFKQLKLQGEKGIVNQVFVGARKEELGKLDPVIVRQSAFSTENYRFDFHGKETIGGFECYKLKVVPIGPNKKVLLDGFIWITEDPQSKELFLVRVFGEPAELPSLKAKLGVSSMEIQRDFRPVEGTWVLVRDRAETRLRKIAPVKEELHHTITVVEHSGYQFSDKVAEPKKLTPASRKKK